MVPTFSSSIARKKADHDYMVPSVVIECRTKPECTDNAFLNAEVMANEAPCGFSITENTTVLEGISDIIPVEICHPG